jgi:hypothetical protein
MKTRNFLKCCLITGFLIFSMTQYAAFGEETWRTDFDTVCAQSNEAMTLSVSDLKMLIDKCDRLQKVIEAQEETVRKVFLKRLQLCRNLYVFVLESKQQPK